MSTTSSPQPAKFDKLVSGRGDRYSSEDLSSDSGDRAADRRVEDEDNPVGDRPEAAEGLDELDDQPGETYSDYRALSPAAVVSCALGVGSFVAFLSWWLAAVPLAGLALGVLAWRRIAARSDELTGRIPAAVGVVLSAMGLVGGQATLWYERLTEVPDGHVRITYDDLQPDPRIANQVVPPSVAELDGERVFIKGYVLAGNRKDGIRTFILVRDKGDCCFGGNPKLTDRILVQLKPGQSFSYTDRLQKLAGHFQVRQGQAVDVSGDVVYQLDDAEIL